MATYYTSEFYKRVSTNITKAEQLYLYVSNNTDITSGIGSVKYHNDVLSNIQWGKKIEATNIYALIREIPWQLNKVFAQYDDTHPNLETLDFYCLNSNRAVYKCLNNNGSRPSTEEPQSNDLTPFNTSDGYTWKYMYRLTIDEFTNRSFDDLIPVKVEVSVQNNAVPGTIDSVNINFPGKYSAVHDGTVVNKVSNFIFRVQDDANSIEDFYKDSAFYIEAGPSSGSLSKVLRYYSNTTGRYVELDRPLSSVTNISSYSIAPFIEIIGDGDNSSARAIMNNDGSVGSIEIINKGINFTYAGINVLTSPSTTHIAAVIRPIVSPLMGHGGDAKEELYSSSILISMDVNGSELASIYVPSQFNNYGLISNVYGTGNVLFSNEIFSSLITIEVSSLNGEFEVGQIIYRDDNQNYRAKVISKIPGETAIYNIIHEGRKIFADNNTIRNNLGILGFITSITFPQTVLTKADILSYNNVNLLTHQSDDKTTFNIVISTKP